MPIVEVAVVPVGTHVASMAQQVAAAEEAARRRGIKHQVTPVATILEGSLQEALDCARDMHEAALHSGSPRVVTRITIDQHLAADRHEGRREGSMERSDPSREHRAGGGRREDKGFAGADQHLPAGREV